MKKLTINTDVLIFDTETTGLDGTAEICELSIINGDGIVVFNSLIKPNKPIPEELTKIHGITNEMVKNSPNFTDIYPKLIEIFQNKHAICYNSAFDIRMLQQASLLNNLSSAVFEGLKAKTQCAMLWFGNFIQQTKFVKLSKACEHMRINISEIITHRALADCQLTLSLIKVVNSKLEFMKPGHQALIYPKMPDKSEVLECIYEGVTPNSTIAKVLVNGKSAFYDLYFIEKFLIENITNLPDTTNLPEVLKSKNNAKLIIGDEIKINYILPVINFDEVYFQSKIDEVLLPIKNLGNDLDKETLNIALANLRRFQQQVSAGRIAITKEIKKPITEFEAIVKKGDESIELLINKYAAELEKIRTKEKIAKTQEIEKLIPAIAINNNLNPEFTKQLIVLDDYLLVKWTLAKINEDLQARAKELFKQQDYIKTQIELRNVQIENRTRLIESLNVKYGFNFTYAQLPIEKYMDEQVHELFNKKTELEQIKLAKFNQEKFTDELKNNIISESEKKLVNTEIAQTEFDNEITKLIYQNLKLGGINQMAILKAVAKLKTDGLSVEFI